MPNHPHLFVNGNGLFIYPNGLLKYVNSVGQKFFLPSLAAWMSVNFAPSGSFTGNFVR